MDRAKVPEGMEEVVEVCGDCDGVGNFGPCDCGKIDCDRALKTCWNCRGTGITWKAESRPAIDFLEKWVRAGLGK